MSRNDTAQFQTCPDRDELSAFNRGRLPLEKLDSIAEHLACCAPCESSLDALQRDDTILSHLRRDPSRTPMVDEAACARLAERALALAAEEVVQPTVTDDRPAKEAKGLALPAAFGPYLLLERLGDGGMGIVYKARQELLKRLVAVKMVKAGAYASDADCLRFHREGEAIARIRHQHVVQIYEFGEHGDQPFFSMELLEGGSLASKLKAGPLAERAAVELVRTLAQAVQAAHQQGVVHRDLKPSNVLFAADGTAKITDFGLAKLLDDADNQTLTDAILGTPSYMAPEQARGENRSVGPSADVYALGAILYEALIGRPPFLDESRFQTMELVRTRDPQPPTRYRPELARDLEAVCLKCLEKEPNRRYGSAADLADDLQRWLDGRPTQARPASKPQRAGQALRRHRLLAVSACVLGVAAIFLAAILYQRDPERKIENLQARRRRGETVTLLGAKGPPAWSDWALRRQGNVIPSPRGDGAFTLVSLEPALLTLLRDPQGSYLYRAEVRHDDTTRLGTVGIYFGHSQHATPDGVQHCFSVLRFDDFESLSPDPKTGAKTSRLDWQLQRSTEAFNTSTYLGAHHFPPAPKDAPGLYPWRQLAAEVSPDGIRVFWERQLVGQLTRQEILLASTDLNNDAVHGGGQPFASALQPAFSPRDAVGLYVSRGKASFRNVVVEPLP